MEIFLEALAKLDLGTIIVLLGGMYLMNKSHNSVFDAKFHALERKIESRFTALDSKIDKMQESVTDIDRRLCRLEGAFASKDCCMIKDSNQMKKAE